MPCDRRVGRQFLPQLPKRLLSVDRMHDQGVAVNRSGALVVDVTVDGAVIRQVRRQTGVITVFSTVVARRIWRVRGIPTGPGSSDTRNQLAPDGRYRCRRGDRRV